jgi:hypothetical protein
MARPLYREIKAQGYPGQERQVHRFLVLLRGKVHIIQKAQHPHVPLQDFSAQDAVWLFARAPADLDKQEHETLSAVCQASATAQQTRPSGPGISAAPLISGKETSWRTGSPRRGASGIGELQSFVPLGGTRQSGGGGRAHAALQQWAG